MHRNVTDSPNEISSFGTSNFSFFLFFSLIFFFFTKQPDFLPSKFQLDLKQLFPSQEDKIGSLIQECSQGRTQCSICSHPFAKSNESSFHFSYSWKIDFHQKTLQLSALQVNF